MRALAQGRVMHWEWMVSRMCELRTIPEQLLSEWDQGALTGDSLPSDFRGLGHPQSCTVPTLATLWFSRVFFQCAPLCSHG